MRGAYDTVINNIPKPDGQEKVIKQYQSTGDIIKDLIYCFKNYNYQAEGLKPIFSTGDIVKDGHKIWAFIKYNIPYDAEPESNQTTKSFSRIIHDAKEVGHDCKHSALLAGSLAWQLGYTVIFKFVNYNKATNNYGHVYTVIENPATGKRVTIDPLQDFDYAKGYKKGVNYKAVNYNNMKKMGTLSRLTGVDDELNGIGEVYEINGVASIRMIDDSDLMHGIGKAKKAMIKPMLKVAKSAAKTPLKSALRPVQTAKRIVAPKAAAKSEAKKATKKVEKKARQVARKAKPNKLKAKIKERGGLVKAVAKAPIRAALSVILLANFGNYAGRLNKMLTTNPDKIKQLSNRFGYKYDIFVKQIKQGATKKPKFGSKQNGIAGVDDVILLQGIGVIALATAIATAAPAILAITQLFKSHGLEEPQDNAALVEAGENIRVMPDQAPDAEPVEDQSAYAPEEVTEEAPAEEVTEEEAQNGTQRKAKGLKIIDKIETTTKAAQSAAKAYSATAAASKAAQAKAAKATQTKAPASDEDEGKSFVDRMSDSIKEHPVWWITGTAVTIYAGSKILRLGR